jgi:hypothetical protein
MVVAVMLWVVTFTIRLLSLVGMMCPNLPHIIIPVAKHTACLKPLRNG